jgi:gamma-glutamylcyclotransferase (GGCT)/AIG2-like uncharacterized protein YtfP
MTHDRLFVYGTLRRGSNNYYAELLAKTARHLGEGAVSGRLYRVTLYPALVKAQAEHERVKGDLFEGITAELWALLDDYEGDEYAREIVDVTMADGGTLQAYVYRYVLSSESLEWIRSGDWNQPDRIES